MSKFLSIRVREDCLEEHVKRICRTNLKKPAKICTHCPIIEPVIGVMEKQSWK